MRVNARAWYYRLGLFKSGAIRKTSHRSTVLLCHRRSPAVSVLKVAAPMGHDRGWQRRASERKLRRLAVARMEGCSRLKRMQCAASSVREDKVGSSERAGVQWTRGAGEGAGCK